MSKLIYLSFAFFAVAGTLVISADAKPGLSRQAKADYQKQFSALLHWEGAQESISSSWFQAKLQEFGPKLQNVFMTVGQQSTFVSRFKPHMTAWLQLRDIIKSQESLDDVLRLAGALRDRPEMNPKLWLQAFLSAKIERDDMGFLRFPNSLVEIMPDEFIPREIFHKSEEELHSRGPGICLVVDETFGEDNGAENALWFFREDMMVNAHHFMWHVFYLTIGEVRPDRRGELFSFMHHEFLVRYYTERMTHSLPSIAPLPLDYVTPMETYRSHLSDANSGSNFTDRVRSLPLVDTAYYYHGGIPGFPGPAWINSSIQAQVDLEKLIYEDIRSGHLVLPNGSFIELDGLEGTDLLGEIIESSSWSLNPERYDESGIHNNGHSSISGVMTPFSMNFSEVVGGVMARPATSMRDPIFYRWHLLIENFFLEHKNLLEPYSPAGSDFPLRWSAIQITDLKVTAEGGQLPSNQLQTFWAQKIFNFTRGLDHSRNSSSEPTLICAKHLDHVEFDYEINVENYRGPADTNATVRIYMARREDVNARRFSMEEQHGLFFTLDQFSVKLSYGANKIIRNSRNSSLTIPFESWTDLQDGDVTSNNCGCGWPHHLLLPKGSTGAGTTYDLFAMITEGDEDTALEEDDDYCSIAPMWCGIRGRKYPSRFPLGYPFDRRPYSVNGNVVPNLDEYVRGIPNMRTVQVRIYHLEN